MSFTGWDIGGAHLKLARTNKQGQLLQAEQYPCALWKGIEHLQQAMQQAITQFNNADDSHLITMTGELVDAFADRAQGVAAIIDCVTQLLQADIKIYAGQKNWLSPEQAKQNWQQVASMNWQASAAFAAQSVASGLFIDIGSTTCDIIPIINHQIVPQGLTDKQRQMTGELVYTGAIRTPLMAICDHTFIDGQYTRLAAEWFATTADIWCILEQLSANDIQDASADGQSWTVDNCQTRLARMVGADKQDLTPQQWNQMARWFAEKQIQTITEACLQILSHHSDLASQTIIGAGVGRFIIQLCAQRLGCNYIDYTTLCQQQLNAANYAPAAALALLASQEFA